MHPLSHKYKPKKLDEFLTHAQVILQLKKFVLQYKTEKKRIAIIVGPVGSGKTSLVHTLAQELQYELLEINSSDTRNEAAIESIVGTASKQRSFFFKGKIILLDDIDGLSGTDDRGGITTILKVAQESYYPLICTAIDISDQKFSQLRGKSLIITLESPTTSQIVEILKKICIKENISFDEEALRQLGRQSGGDVRAALNDVQILANGKITKEEVATLSNREQEEELGNALIKIFKSTDPLVAASALSNVDEDLDNVTLWIDENIPSEYEKKEDLARAYHFLSLANIFKRRIMRNQHWRFMVYINDFITAGVAVSKDAKNPKMIEYKRSTRPLQIWMANQKYLKRKNIAEKIASENHLSKKEAVKIVPFLQKMCKNQKNAKAFQEEFEFDDEEMEWLKKER